MSATPSVKCLWKFSVVVIKTFLTTTAQLLFLLSNLSAQEYSYAHYDVKDGLAGSTVYDITQDKDGFIWFATETGVSRFDGTHFKNFTTADGLPDTEILKVYADSKGRIWMAPFRNAIAYYYKGKIHTRKNDSFISKIPVPALVHACTEDKEGNMLLITITNDIIVISTDSLMKIAFRLFKWPTSISLLGKNPAGRGFVFGADNSIYTIIDGKIAHWMACSHLLVDETLIKLFPNGTMQWIKYPPGVNGGMQYEWDSQNLFRNTYKGSWLIDSNSMTYSKVFLPDKQISKTIIDKEQNTWFATLGQGAFKLVSQEIKTWWFQKNASPEIYSLNKTGNTLYCGSDFGKVFTLTANKIDTLFFEKFAHWAKPNYSRTNRLVSTKTIADTSVLMLFDDMLIRYNPVAKRATPLKIRIPKSVDVINEDTLLLGTGQRVYLVEKNTLKIIDTIWPQRSTAVAYYNNASFVGTINGLYTVGKNKTSHFLGEKFPFLDYRIGDFAKDAYGNLWIATFGGGLIQLKNDNIVRHFSSTKGLTSDICRTLFLQNNYLWVGTDKGIIKINISDPSYPIICYSTDDGLPSNIINDIYAENDSVYVASPAGLTIFEESKIFANSICNLKLLDASVSGRPRLLDSLSSLKYTENSLRFNFVGISFRSGGDILYRYRLKGLNNEWDSTRQTVLEFLSLPSGSYELELIAINKFGVASNPVSISFTIATPFWQTLWFKIAVIAAIVFLTWWLVNRRFVAIRKREQEKISLHDRLNDLEQLALRAQMNPHFIFNCLNSIQNFIIHNDLETTNQYLTEFAHLIRQTLDNAAKSTLSIDNEVRYLTRYLEMEKMRFGHSFDYSITVDPQIDQEYTFIPTMILQPYIENCIRHGVRYKQNGKGLIEIMFEKNENELLCIVQDNGIGREKAATLKSQMHVEYQSKGMKLTEERIKALNRTLPSPVTITVIDRKGADGHAAGTRIEIHFPNEILI